MFDTIIREAASRFGLGDKGAMLVQMLLAYMTNKDTSGLSGFIDKFNPDFPLGSIRVCKLGREMDG